MRKILLVPVFALSLVALQACKNEQLAECPAGTMTTWDDQAYDQNMTVAIVEGYGAVHDTYIKVERRGVQQRGQVVDSNVCEMSRIYCPEPHSDKGCQIYKCDYLEPSNAVLKAEDYQGTKYYNVPVASRVVWDGYTLRCENS